MVKLTEQEEEAMQVIWQSQGGFISDLLKEMPDPKPPYTTLASTIKNLEKKGFVAAQKMGSSYQYTPLIDEQTYKKLFMKVFIGNYFKNSYRELVAFFATEKQISADELKEIIDLIETKKNQ